jgi:hypothetical protein
VGHLLWSSRYSLGAGAGTMLTASGFPGLRLSDDGGAFVAGLAQASEVGEGKVWAMKLFAKDGTAKDAAQAVRSALPLVDLECSLRGAPWSPMIAAATPSGESVVPSTERATFEHVAH